jgi:hypothetical protein
MNAFYMEEQRKSRLLTENITESKEYKGHWLKPSYRDMKERLRSSNKKKESSINLKMWF